MNIQGKKPQRKKNLGVVEEFMEIEKKKKEFCIFYICEILNGIYGTYKKNKPVYIHFICSQEKENNNFEKKQLFYYTPNSVLEQYFPDHFQNVYFLCAHYSMWKNKLNNHDKKNESGTPLGIFNEESDKQNNGNKNDQRKKYSCQNEETFYFIFTFYMQPNFMWEEINMPIFHDKGYIECKFDCIDNMIKLSDNMNLAQKVKGSARNQTLIQCIREGFTNKEDPNIRHKGNVHLLPFFISTQQLYKNCRVCQTRVISFNEKDIYCKIDKEENFPRQLLLLVKKKLQKRLKNMHAEVIQTGENKKIEIKKRKKEYEKSQKITSLEFIDKDKKRNKSYTTTRGRQKQNVTHMEEEAKHVRDSLTGIDCAEIQQLIRCTDAIFERSISDEQMEKLLLQIKSKGYTRNMCSAIIHSIPIHGSAIHNIPIHSRAIPNRSIATVPVIPVMPHPHNQEITSRSTHITNNQDMNKYLGLGDYYKYFASSKNELKNTLQDPWQLGIGVKKTIKKKKKSE
ncbi:hypothetical protein PGO_144360 [Plasmodium gonderi]|uniref:Uncharacterized protein n=1 Tax=Plasmodium gonderi TaxID=77519 RepID=A0A1Y1JQ64_PLAGO|nr:hypothetical protein PGO_144360 [Plasmodium gonderi]GAW83638.1 hypothetical protein PGO_144360 [Plasmodium gonderi]